MFPLLLAGFHLPPWAQGQGSHPVYLAHLKHCLPIPFLPQFQQLPNYTGRRSLGYFFLFIKRIFSIIHLEGVPPISGVFLPVPAAGPRADCPGCNVP